MDRGVGQHIDAILESGEIIRGEIREIADDHFVVLLDGTGALADITYDRVRQIGPIVMHGRKSFRAPTTRDVIETVAVVIGALLVFPRLAKP
jgi:hypothetical protein